MSLWWEKMPDAASLNISELWTDDSENQGKPRCTASGSHRPNKNGSRITSEIRHYLPVTQLPFNAKTENYLVASLRCDASRVTTATSLSISS